MRTTPRAIASSDESTHRPRRSPPTLLSGATLILAVACSPDPSGSNGDLDGAMVIDVVLGGGDAAADPDVAVADATGDTGAADADTDAPDEVGSDATPPDTGSGDTPEADTGVADVPADTGAGDTPSDAADGRDADIGPPSFVECFAGQLPESGVPLVDYDGLGATLGRHCMGTNHQDIVGVERVIFAGDSVTVGTPPTLTGEWYRNRLAAALASRFDLRPPDFLWQNVDVINGVSLSQTSGDFASCAKWGARTDDITSPPHQQIQTCAPEDQRDKVTLIVMTVGGNDFFSWAQDLVDGVPIETLWGYAEQMVADMEASIHWVVDEPSPFPNGAYVVFASNFEFTDVDSANDFATCPGAGIISMDTALVDPRMTELGAWVMGEYMRIAVETGTDMIFMGERFCGHGHMRDDPEGRCYHGPGEALWLDVTCLHPSAAGHAAIAEMFLAVIDE